MFKNILMVTLLFYTSFAYAIQIKEGIYQFTMDGSDKQESGMCLTNNGFNKEAYLQRMRKIEKSTGIDYSDCKILKYKVSGNTETVEMQCTSDTDKNMPNITVIQKSVTTYDFDSYSGTIVSQAKIAGMTIPGISANISASFLRPCSTSGNLSNHITSTNKRLDEDDSHLTYIPEKERGTTHSPKIISENSASVYENQRFAIDVDATDQDGDDLTYSIIGGEDITRVRIDSATGKVTFIISPDFERKSIYKFTVGVSDGSYKVKQDVVIYILDLDES